ncbi:MAG TPA: hypothetical protein VNN62_26535 [Methylomirabilota bacterium]|nr:hypothetical protein [Methylomirabilota bacterium]
MSEEDEGVVAAEVWFELDGVVVPLAGGVGEVFDVVAGVAAGVVWVGVGFVVVPAVEDGAVVLVGAVGAEDGTVAGLDGAVAVPEGGEETLVVVIGARDVEEEEPAVLEEEVVFVSVEVVDEVLDEEGSVEASLIINTPSRVAHVNP